MCATNNSTKQYHSVLGRPIFSISPVTMMPVGAMGESELACAPLAAMMVIRNGEMPVWPATAIAIGPSRAIDAMLPGPIDPKMNASTKNMIGIKPALPRQLLTARNASLPRVPLTSASVKSSVTPVRVRKSCVGNPALMSPRDIPPKYTPMIHAMTTASTPMLILEMQLRVIAITSAQSEAMARFTAAAYDATYAVLTVV